MRRSDTALPSPEGKTNYEKSRGKLRIERDIFLQDCKNDPNNFFGQMRDSYVEMFTLPSLLFEVVRENFAVALCIACNLNNGPAQIGRSAFDHFPGAMDRLSGFGHRRFKTGESQQLSR